MKIKKYSEVNQVLAKLYTAKTRAMVETPKYWQNTCHPEPLGGELGVLPIWVPGSRS